MELTVSPELSVVRVANRGAARSVEVRAFTITGSAGAPLNRKVSGVQLPPGHDLAVAVPDWKTLDVTVQAVAFE